MQQPAWIVSGVANGGERLAEIRLGKIQTTMYSEAHH
jgi:hypothetical protein